MMRGGGKISGGGRRPNPKPFSEESHFCLGRVEDNPGGAELGLVENIGLESNMGMKPVSTTY